MLIYIIIFIVTAILAFWQFDKKRKVSPYFFISYTMAIGVFVGISDMLGGYDRYIYGEIYTLMSNSITNGEGFFNEAFLNFSGKEPMYGLINEIVGLFTPNRYIFIFLYTILLYIIYAICFYRYTEQPFFALLVFTGLMFFFTFTYLRQVLAAGIVWLALPFYTKRKFWQFMVMIVVATMTHNSAAIMAILYFLPLRKWHFEKIMVVMLILLGLGMIGVGETFTIVGELSGSENIAKHADDAEAGFRYEYVIESFLFLFILHQNYKQVRNDREVLSYLNLYLVFCGVLLLFCKSGDGGRISWYGTMGIIIMLTKFCKGMRGIQLRVILTILFFALYFRVLSAWEFNMCPYKTFFTPGHTAEEWIYEKYEYDKNYDLDKFYNL